MSTFSKGKAIQNHVKKVLVEKGYFFIAENFKFKNGEIDLILQDGDFIVFIEVKSSWNTDVFELLSPTKLKRFKAAIDYWLEFNGKQDATWRADYIGVKVAEKGLKIEHIEFINF